MLNDPVANSLSKINNAEKRSKKICLIKPTSKTIQKILDLLKAQEYIKETKIHSEGNDMILEIHLLGRINKCGAIKPRHAVNYKNMEKYEKRYLAAKDFGVIILTTSKGIMTHTEAKKQKIGGKLLAYCY